MIRALAYGAEVPGLESYGGDTLRRPYAVRCLCTLMMPSPPTFCFLSRSLLPLLTAQLRRTPRCETVTAPFVSSQIAKIKILVKAKSVRKASSASEGSGRERACATLGVRIARWRLSNALRRCFPSFSVVVAKSHTT